MLLMKKQFFPAIRAGRKTTTLRFWLRPHVRCGSVHRVPGLGRVRILEVDVVDLARLDHADALADGFASADEVRCALDDLYPPALRGNRRLFRIRFELCEADAIRP